VSVDERLTKNLTGTVGAPQQTGTRRRILRSLRDTCSLLARSRSKVWSASDAAVGVLAALLGFCLSPSFRFTADAPARPELVIPAFGLALVFAGMVSGLYEDRAFQSRFSLLACSVLAVVLAWLGVLAASYALVFRPVGRWIVLISSLFALAGVLLPRLLVYAGVSSVRRKVLTVGHGKGLSAVRELLRQDANRTFDLVEEGEPATAHPAGGREAGAEIRDDRSSLLETVERVGANVVIVENGETPRRSFAAADADEIMACLRRGVEVVDAWTFAEKYYRQVLPGALDALDASWLVSAHLHVCRPPLLAIKRTCDLAGAIGGLVLTLPFWPLIALLIKATSKGSVFYRQERMGRSGVFAIYKFRTMEEGAEAQGEPRWAEPDDPRVTALGRILRRLHLDELPQFWNILKGDMSLIGPRPERPEFVRTLARKMPCYGWRQLVRPGMTGWAQINYGYGASEDDAREKLSYDLYYVKHFSFGLDAYIALRTLGALVVEGRRRAPAGGRGGVSDPSGASGPLDPSGSQTPQAR
jgi:exopolysaccharide biosynthesis polyprenyl glycosylphosphotransferase